MNNREYKIRKLAREMAENLGFEWNKLYLEESRNSSFDRLEFIRLAEIAFKFFNK